MTATLTRSANPLREALYTLSLAQYVPNAEVLDDVIRRYPEHAQALTEFAIELAMDALCGDSGADSADSAIDPTKVSPAVSRAMSRFQNRLYEAQRADAAAARHSPPAMTGAANPFAGLDRTAFRAFAERLNANTVFVAKLRDRQVESQTITAGFSRRVADELMVPLDVVVAHFAAEGSMQFQSQFYKADHKPELGTRQSFADAVRSSGLSDLQQRYLLSL